MKYFKKRFLLNTISAFSAAAVIWAGSNYVRMKREYDRGDEDLNRVYFLMSAPPDVSVIESDPRTPLIKNDGQASGDRSAGPAINEYVKLKAENPDLVGWVRIEGTAVNYPVMQTPSDPDFYLRRGFDRNESIYGMIYMDASCKIESGCPNYILYGHHMKNGAMFAAVEEYRSRDFYEAHPSIGFDTLEETGEYEIVAAVGLTAGQMDDAFMRILPAETESDYDSLIDFVKQNNFYDTGITPDWPEQLVTLMTCEYSQRDGRIVIIAREKKRQYLAHKYFQR